MLVYSFSYSNFLEMIDNNSYDKTLGSYMDSNSMNSFSDDEYFWMSNEEINNSTNLLLVNYTHILINYTHIH